jgi:hypothetical protein
MSAELFFMPGLYSTGPAYPPAEPRMRNLGSAIFLAAIADYRSLDQEAHDHAELFLYPQTQDWQDHYEWAVALLQGLNPEWLRDALDQSKLKWDGERSARMRAKRPSRKNLN